MIYARHAEACVTVCLMHWSSLDPLLPSLCLTDHRAAPFFLPSFRGCLADPNCRPPPSLSAPRRHLAAMKAARSRAARDRVLPPRARKSDASGRRGPISKGLHLWASRCTRGDGQ